MAPARSKNVAHNTNTAKKATQSADDDPGEPPGSGLGSPMVAVMRPSSDTEGQQAHVVPDSEPERQATSSAQTGDKSTRVVEGGTDGEEIEEEHDDREVESEQLVEGGQPLRANMSTTHVLQHPPTAHSTPLLQRNRAQISIPRVALPTKLPILFGDSWREHATQYGPFNELRERLSRLKIAFEARIFDDNEYRRQVHDIMNQGDQWYTNHHLVREVRREEKHPERPSPEDQPPKTDRSRQVAGPPPASEEQEIEDQILLSILQQSKNEARAQKAGNTSNTRGIDVTSSHAANVHRAIRPNNAFAATPEADGSFTSESNNDGSPPAQPIEPWSIPDYPHTPGQQDTPIEGQYRYLRSKFLQLKGATENITRMHANELKCEKDMYAHMHDLDQDGYWEMHQERESIRTCLMSMYSTVLDHVGEIRVLCRELMVACWAEGDVEGMAPASIFAYVLRLARIIDAFGRSVAVLDRERHNHNRKQQKLPEKPLHHAGRPDRALGDQLRSMVSAEVVPGYDETNQYYDSFFFLKLGKVSWDVGELPNVDRVPALRNPNTPSPLMSTLKGAPSATASRRAPSREKTPTRRLSFRPVPQLVLDPIPGGGDDSDPSSSSSSDEGRNGHDDPFGDLARRKRDKQRRSRKPELMGREPSVPAIPRFERLETPALSMRPIQRYDAPDPPGMGGMHFPDEKPHWIALVDALDKLKGMNAEDTAFRNAKSQATGNIRQLMAENANTVIGKGILALNNIKVDHNHISRYDGLRGVRDLERYVTQFLDHFEMANMLSPDEAMEKHRVLMFGSRLSGPAHEFWIRNVSRRASSWTKEQFDRFKQRAGESVQSAYLRLQEYSEGMTYEASPYDMKYRFFHGVKDEIRGHLAHDDCSPEKSRWMLRDMVKLAMNIEEGIEKGKPRNFQVQTAHEKTSGKPNYNDERKNKQCSSRAGDGNHRNDQNDHELEAGHHKEPHEDLPKPSNTAERKINSGIPRPKTRSRYVVNKDVAKDQCLKCHKRGHWAQDCPMVYRGNAVIDPSADAARELTEAALSEHKMATEGGNLKAVVIDGGPAPATTGFDVSYDGHGPPTDYSSINYALSAAVVMLCKPDKITVANCHNQSFHHHAKETIHRNRGGSNQFDKVSCEVMSGYITIGKSRAHVMIDTGSEVQMMSSNYARAADIPILPID